MIFILWSKCSGCRTAPRRLVTLVTLVSHLIGKRAHRWLGAPANPAVTTGRTSCIARAGERAPYLLEVRITVGGHAVYDDASHRHDRRHREGGLPVRGHVAPLRLGATERGPAPTCTNPSIAKNYDAEYAVIRDPSGDRAFYAALARASGGPVLELGCGTGRVLLPIAEVGIPSVGLDLSANMLDVLRGKKPPANLELVRASMTDFDLGAGRFKLIFAAFRAFQHLCTVEEQLAALACIRRHLAPGATLAFDVFAPDLARTAIEDEPEAEDLRAPDGDEEIRRFVKVRRDLATQVMTIGMRHERWRAGAKLEEGASELRLRWFHRYELEHLLARAGLAIEALYGGFDRGPYTAKREMIVIARAA
jgi:SAM-dependent methyltransferase